VLCISNGKLYSGCRRSRRPQAKKCGEGSLANAGGQWPKSPKYLRRLESFCLCLLHIPLVIHIRQHGSSIIAYRQIACCQSMQIHQQLMVVQAVTNSSAVGCLFCWASLNSSPPSSRDSGRRLYHALSLRSSQSHPTIPQAAATTRICPPYPTQPSPHACRKDPLFTSRVSRRVSPHKHKQWQRHPWQCQPQAQA
jgi:hypothetical protein